MRVNLTFDPLQFSGAFLLASQHGRHGVPVPLLLPEHAVQVLVVTLPGHGLVDLVQGVRDLLLVHLALSQAGWSTRVDIHADVEPD